MNPKLIWFAIGLLTGGAIGGVGGSLYFKNKYQKKYEEDIEEMEDYYKAVDEYKRSSKVDNEEVNPSYSKGSDKTETGRENGPLSKEERRIIKEKLEKNWEGTTNYAAMFESELEDEAGVGGEPDDDEEDPSLSEGEGNAPVVDVEATNDHRKNRDKRPKIISAEAVGEMPAYYERETFFYYKESGTIADEVNNEIPDPETYLGDCMTKYDFDINDEERIFVVNYQLDTIYEIQKLKGRFEG